MADEPIHSTEMCKRVPAAPNSMSARQTAYL
jgi:hypothetical protein